MDLSLSRQDLGFTDKRDPEEQGISKKESMRRLDALVSACQSTIRDKMLPELRKDFARVIGPSGWNVALDPADPQTVIFTYPSSGFSEDTPSYIRPAIRLEMGARSDDWPAELRIIRPYAAEAFPEAFRVAASCSVNTMEAVRTFGKRRHFFMLTTIAPQGRHRWNVCRDIFTTSTDCHKMTSAGRRWLARIYWPVLSHTSDCFCFGLGQL